jgi:hypothetical protein
MPIFKPYVLLEIAMYRDSCDFEVPQIGKRSLTDLIYSVQLCYIQIPSKNKTYHTYTSLIKDLEHFPKAMEGICSTILDKQL